MSIKNISIQTYGLHVGESNYAITTSQQFPYKETGVSVISLVEKGNFLFDPYTEELDAYKKF